MHLEKQPEVVSGHVSRGRWCSLPTLTKFSAWMNNLGLALCHVPAPLPRENRDPARLVLPEHVSGA